MNTLAIGGPCRLCGRPNIEHGHGHCPPAVQWVADGVARVAARLATDPEFAKSLLPSMTHAEVKAALRPKSEPSNAAWRAQLAEWQKPGGLLHGPFI